MTSNPNAGITDQLIEAQREALYAPIVNVAQHKQDLKRAMLDLARQQLGEQHTTLQASIARAQKSVDKAQRDIDGVGTPAKPGLSAAIEEVQKWLSLKQATDIRKEDLLAVLAEKQNELAALQSQYEQALTAALRAIEHDLQHEFQELEKRYRKERADLAEKINTAGSLSGNVGTLRHALREG